MAKKDNVDQFAFELKVIIDSDDDFKLSIPHTFTVTGPTRDELTRKLLTCLASAKLAGTGIHDQRWYDIRDAAITDLNAGVLDFEHGGNQTIKVELTQEPDCLADFTPGS